MTTDTTWTPGDPLYPRSTNGGAQYRAGLFNFRDDSRTQECHCPDAAWWPTPRTDLGDGDELGEFIAEYRRARESA